MLEETPTEKVVAVEPTEESIAAVQALEGVDVSAAVSALGSFVSTPQGKLHILQRARRNESVMYDPELWKLRFKILSEASLGGLSAHITGWEAIRDILAYAPKNIAPALNEPTVTAAFRTLYDEQFPS